MMYLQKEYGLMKCLNLLVVLVELDLVVPHEEVVVQPLLEPMYAPQPHEEEFCLTHSTQVSLKRL
jgi:hypothetical protein